MSNITYHSLHDYVGGSCISKTFDIDSVTHSDHLTEISTWLNSITERLQDGELREEWIVCDYEDVPSEFVSEYQIDESFFDLMEAISKSGLDAEVFYAGIALGFDLDQIEDHYYGYYESERDLAEEYADSCLDIPESTQRYFDYAALGRDLSCDFSEYNGHYFH